jgi:hypothetical protein
MSTAWSSRRPALSAAALCFALSLGGTVFVAAAAEPPPFGYSAMGVENGCFVESVACFDAFHEAFGEEAWGRVLQWGSREDEVMAAGHAVAVFESAGALWCWDINHGWMRLSVAPAERDEAAVVAAPILANYPQVTALFPILWDDSGQAPAKGPAGAGSAASRDAPMAAARLARHRPVNLIEISRPEDGEARTSEAIVFVFGGRMCLYSPEKGTMIFRARSSVWNVHLTQEMVRRMFPGAKLVRSLDLPGSGS